MTDEMKTDVNKPGTAFIRAVLERGAEMINSENDLALQQAKSETHRQLAEAYALHAAPPQYDAAVLECSFCKSAGLGSANLEKMFRPDVLEKADDKSIKGLALSELLLRGAESAGWSGNRNRLTRAN